jgi:hypothetical protein
MCWGGRCHRLVHQGLKACGCKVFGVDAEGGCSSEASWLVEEDEDVSVREIELGILAYLH